MTEKPIAHVYQLSYRHTASSGFRTRCDGTVYGAEWGTCADCGEAIVRPVAEGETTSGNRRRFVAWADLQAAYVVNEARGFQPSLFDRTDHHA